jgi:hypothetical protein
MRTIPKDGAPLTSLLRDSVLDTKNEGRARSTVPVDLPPGVRLAKGTGAFVLPKTPAALADLLYVTRNMRLDIQHRIETLEKLEGELKNYFIENLPKSQASGIAGKVARVQIETKPIPQVSEWTEFYAYIHKNKAYELLQRRLSEGAVKERMDAGEHLPGVTIFQAKKVSVVKL